MVDRRHQTIWRWKLGSSCTLPNILLSLLLNFTQTLRTATTFDFRITNTFARFPCTTFNDSTPNNDLFAARGDRTLVCEEMGGSKFLCNIAHSLVSEPCFFSVETPLSNGKKLVVCIDLDRACEQL